MESWWCWGESRDPRSRGTPGGRRALRAGWPPRARIPEPGQGMARASLGTVGAFGEAGATRRARTRARGRGPPHQRRGAAKDGGGGGSGGAGRPRGGGGGDWGERCALGPSPGLFREGQGLDFTPLPERGRAGTGRAGRHCHRHLAVSEETPYLAKLRGQRSPAPEPSVPADCDPRAPELRAGRCGLGRRGSGICAAASAGSASHIVMVTAAGRCSLGCELSLNRACWPALGSPSPQRPGAGRTRCACPATGAQPHRLRPGPRPRTRPPAAGSSPASPTPIPSPPVKTTV